MAGSQRKMGSIFFQRSDSNPGRLGGKRKRCLCAMPSLNFGISAFAKFNKLTKSQPKLFFFISTEVFRFKLELICLRWIFFDRHKAENCFGPILDILERTRTDTFAFLSFFLRSSQSVPSHLLPKIS